MIYSPGHHVGMQGFWRDKYILALLVFFAALSLTLIAIIVLG